MLQLYCMGCAGIGGRGWGSGIGKAGTEAGNSSYIDLCMRRACLKAVRVTITL